MVLPLACMKATHTKDKSTDTEKKLNNQESITMVNGCGVREMVKVKLYLQMDHTIKVCLRMISGMD